METIDPSGVTSTLLRSRSAYEPPPDPHIGHDPTPATAPDPSRIIDPRPPACKQFALSLLRGLDGATRIAGTQVVDVVATQACIGWRSMRNMEWTPQRVKEYAWANPKGTWTQAPRRSQNAADAILADNNEDKE